MKIVYNLLKKQINIITKSTMRPPSSRMFFLVGKSTRIQHTFFFEFWNNLIGFNVPFESRLREKLKHNPFFCINSSKKQLAGEAGGWKWFYLSINFWKLNILAVSYQNSMRLNPFFTKIFTHGCFKLRQVTENFYRSMYIYNEFLSNTLRNQIRKFTKNFCATIFFRS